MGGFLSTYAHQESCESTYSLQTAGRDDVTPATPSFRAPPSGRASDRVFFLSLLFFTLFARGMRKKISPDRRRYCTARLSLHNATTWRPDPRLQVWIYGPSLSGNAPGHKSFLGCRISNTKIRWEIEKPVLDQWARGSSFLISFYVTHSRRWSCICPLANRHCDVATLIYHADAALTGIQI